MTPGEGCCDAGGTGEAGATGGAGGAGGADEGSVPGATTCAGRLRGPRMTLTMDTAPRASAMTTGNSVSGSLNWLPTRCRNGAPNGPPFPPTVVKPAHAPPITPPTMPRMIATTLTPTKGAQPRRESGAPAPRA